MFDDLSKQFGELESTLSTSKSFLETLAEERKRLVRYLNKARKDTELLLDKKKYVAYVRQALTKTIINAAKDIIMGEIIQATREYYEFNESIYRKGLLEAIKDNNSYLVRAKGSGFNSIVYVDIDLNKTAGDLMMWGTAVKLAREALNVRLPDRNKKRVQKRAAAAQASRTWAKIFESRGRGGGGKFEKTIKTRLSFSPRPAPWWQLLDKGDTKLVSDRGGFPTPRKPRRGTGFIKATEDAVVNYSKRVMQQEKEKYDILISSYQKMLEDSAKALSEFDILLEQLRLDRTQIAKQKGKAKQVAKSNYITNVEKAVQLIRKGVVTTRGLSTAVRGSYRGKRLSIETVQELLL